MDKAFVLQNGKPSGIFPVFYKKKELPLDKTSVLETKKKGHINVNNQYIENVNVMLDKIRGKDDAFVARLQDYLEQFQHGKVRKVALIEDMLPRWPLQNGDSPNPDVQPQDDDATGQLRVWYGAMEECVETQIEAVDRILSDWFKHLDELASDGEPDAQLSEIEPHTTDSNFEPVLRDSWTIILYSIVILVCVVGLFLFTKPQEIEDCAYNPAACFIKHMLEFCVLVHDYYLAFHNITLEYKCTPALNGSDDFTDEGLNCRFE